jgi:hypothetical protein
MSSVDRNEEKGRSRRSPFSYDVPAGRATSRPYKSPNRSLAECIRDVRISDRDGSDTLRSVGRFDVIGPRVEKG